MVSPPPSSSPGLAIATLGLLVAACPAPPTGIDGCPFAARLPPDNVPMAVVGEPVSLWFAPQVPDLCGPDARVPDTVRIRVQDPLNLPLEAQARLEAPVGWVDFVPRQAGPHHLSILFEPVGGMFEHSLEVGVDRSSETSWPLEPSCQPYSLSPSTLLCGSWLYRDGVPLRSSMPEVREATSVAAGDGLLWRAGPFGIDVWRDTGSGDLERLAESRALATSREPTCVAAADRRLLVHVGDKLFLFELGADDAISRTAERSLGFPTGFAECALVGEEAWVLYRVEAGAANWVSRWPLGESDSHAPSTLALRDQLRFMDFPHVVTEETLLSIQPVRRLRLLQLLPGRSPRELSSLSVGAEGHLVWPTLHPQPGQARLTLPPRQPFALTRREGVVGLETFWNGETEVGVSRFHAWGTGEGGGRRFWRR